MWGPVRVALGMLIGVLAFAQPLDIGSRLELFVDDYLIERMDGAALRMHPPVPRDIAVVHDAPWEGSGTGYHTVFRDGRLYRMYYTAWQLTPTPGKLEIPHDTVCAYVESLDGIHWVKPNLGLFEFQGSKDNNIVWMGKGAHDFTPFIDENPACLPEQRYKALGWAIDPNGVCAFTSPDGIHWSFIREEPVLTGAAFDTQNLAFWDTVRGEYRAYVRDFKDGVRGIRTATSKDLLNWSPLEWLEYPGAPVEALYTNQIKPYYRAPHIYIGFPARYVERGWSPSMEALPMLEHRRLRASDTERYGTAITDSLLMTSRDGITFRRWDEAFLRPGLRTAENWAYGDNYMAWHAVVTRSTLEHAPDELSLYATESYWTGTDTLLRRFTMRIDGFVSVHAPLSGGEFTTRPLVFQGGELVLNFSTSAAGSIRVEVQDAQGAPIDGFGIDDGYEVFGDDLERVVSWKGGRDLKALAGTPVRLRFVLCDADLYSMRFRE